MKLLIFAPYGIGNLILLYPVLKKLKEQKIPFDIASFLGSVDYMLKNWNEFKDLYEKRWYIGGSKSQIFRTISDIRRTKYDYSIVSFPSAKPHYNLLSFLCGAKNRIGSRYPDDKGYKTLSFLNSIKVDVHEGIHDVEQNLRLIQATGLLNSLSIKDISKSCSTPALDKEKRIGFHVGCSANSSYKRWALENWKEIVEILHTNYPEYSLEFFFGPDEKEELAYFQEVNNITIHTGIPLDKTKEMISHCALFISNDSGLMHMASLMDVPTVSVIGPSDDRRTGAFSAKAVILSGTCEFRPCSHNYHLSSHKFHCKQQEIQCMTEITPQIVFEEIKKIL